MAILEIWEKAPQVLSWFKQPEAKVYLADLERKRAKVYQEMKEMNDPLKIAKALGQLIAYEESLELPSKLKDQVERMRKTKEE